MGLLRGLARTAAIAGTATAVSNRVSRRQGGRWAAKDQQAQEQQGQEEQAQNAQQQPQYAQPRIRPTPIRPTPIRSAAGRVVNRRHARTIAEARRIENGRGSHRGGVPGPEGQDPCEMTVASRPAAKQPAM